MTPADIRALRARLDLSQTDLAALVNGEVPGLGLTQANVSRWERGDNAPSGPALTILRRLAGETDDLQLPNRDDAVASWDRAEAAWGKWREELAAEGDAQAVRVADHVLRLARATKRRLGAATDD